MRVPEAGIRVEVEEFVATVTLDRPPANALDAATYAAITTAFDDLGEREDVRVAVLTGAGAIFCGGVDLKARWGRHPGALWEANRAARESFHSVLECKVPVLAALNGPALGAGLALAASCDILVASQSGSLGLPEIDVGLLGGGRHAQRLFGHSRSRRMMFTGLRIGGAELAELGVVEACVAPEALMETVYELAREIARKSPVAIRLAKESLNAIESMSLRDGYRHEQNVTAELRRFEDSKEAVRAFREKRDPVFKGR
jgi:enoyl-CoA hydratase/carnithine racemase